MEDSEEEEPGEASDAEDKLTERGCELKEGYASDGMEYPCPRRSMRRLEEINGKEPVIIDWYYVREALRGRWALRNSTECWQMCQFQLASQRLTVQRNGWESLCCHKQDCVTALTAGLEWWEMRCREEEFKDVLCIIAEAECRLCRNTNL